MPRHGDHALVDLHILVSDPACPSKTAAPGVRSPGLDRCTQDLFHAQADHAGALLEHFGRIFKIGARRPDRLPGAKAARPARMAVAPIAYAAHHHRFDRPATWR
jgi:hypothetical protein